MKIFKNIFFIAAVMTGSCSMTHAVDSVITLFITEQPSDKQQHNLHHSKFISKTLQQPSFIHAIGKDRSWLEQPGVDGIQASYAGYMATSDKNGQITFPRLQQSDTIYLLITQSIEPAYMIGPSLIANWMPNTQEDAAYYEITRKKNKDLKTYYFEINKLATPEKIAHNTIIIYAHPDHIQVPTGVLLNTYSANFILPELHAKKFNTSKNSLYTLSIKQYFEQINIESKNNAPAVTAMITNQ